MTDLGDLLTIVQPGKHEPGRQRCAGCPRTAAIRRMVRGPDGKLYGSGCARKRGFTKPRAAAAPRFTNRSSAREQPAMSQLTTTRRFVVERTSDPSGVSVTGVVIDGVVWPDGTVSTHWRGEEWSNVFWPSFALMESKHCYGGHSRVVWVDEPTPAVVDVVPASTLL